MIPLALAVTSNSSPPNGSSIRPSNSPRLTRAPRLQTFLNNPLAEARTQLGRVVQVDAQFERLKTELLHLVERQYSPAQPTASDSTSTLAAQLDTHAKTLNNLLREVDKTHRYEEQITLARTEVERLNKMVSTFQAQIDTLKKELDERVKGITYIEDQRRADNRQLAELQVELPDLHKKIAANLSKVQLVEQQIPQFGKYEVAIEELRNEIRRSRESTDFQIAERERQMKKWADLAEGQQVGKLAGRSPRDGFQPERLESVGKPPHLS